MIDLINVTKTFKNKSVFNKATLSLAGNQIVSVIGPNGSGKTTFFNILANYDDTTSGKIVVANQKRPKNETVSFFADSNTLVEDLTGWNHLQLFKNQGKVKELISYFGAESFIKKKVKKYSLGMKQILIIIMTIVEERPVLIFDEVLNGLDPLNRQKAIHYFKQLKTDKLILFSSHLLYDVLEISDEIVFIKNQKFDSHQNNGLVDMNSLYQEYVEEAIQNVSSDEI